MTQKSKHLNTTTNQKLSIQISLSGLSFCILDTKKLAVSALENFKFDKKLNPFEALERLMHYFDVRDYLQTKFDDILVIHENDLSSLVPKSLFNEDHIADYLKFNSKILKSDYLSYDTLANNNCVNAYVPYVNINNYIYEAFGSFEYKHYSTILIDEILKINGGTKLYVHVSENHFEIIVLDKQQLVLYNTFEYDKPEDFIYYILFTIEQLQYDTETVALEFLGKVSKDSDLYTIAYKYIRNVSICTVGSCKYNNVSDPNVYQSNYILLNSF